MWSGTKCTASDTDGARRGRGGRHPSLPGPGRDVCNPPGWEGAGMNVGREERGLLVELFVFFRGKENASARQIDAICAVYSGFFYLLWTGSSPSPLLRRACLPGGLRNSFALTTILVSPRYLNGSLLLPPLSPLSLLWLSFPSLPYCHHYSNTPPLPSWPSFSFAPPSPISITLCSVSIPCFLASVPLGPSPCLLSLFQRLQCPFAGDLEVQRPGGGDRELPPTPLPS